MDVTMNAPPFAKLAMIACPALSTAALAKNRAKKGTIASIKINLNPAMDMSCKIVSSVDFLVVFNKNFLNPLNDPFFGILLIASFTKGVTICVPNPSCFDILETK